MKVSMTAREEIKLHKILDTLIDEVESIAKYLTDSYDIVEEENVARTKCMIAIRNLLENGGDK